VSEKRFNGPSMSLSVAFFGNTVTGYHVSATVRQKFSFAITAIIIVKSITIIAIVIVDIPFVVIYYYLCQ
jgi:hypothetical protein